MIFMIHLTRVVTHKVVRQMLMAGFNFSLPATSDLLAPLPTEMNVTFIASENLHKSIGTYEEQAIE